MEGRTKDSGWLLKTRRSIWKINAMFVCSQAAILKVGNGTTTLAGGILFGKKEKIDALTFLSCIRWSYQNVRLSPGSIREFIQGSFPDTIQCKRMDEILPRRTDAEIKHQVIRDMTSTDHGDFLIYDGNTNRF